MDLPDVASIKRNFPVLPEPELERIFDTIGEAMVRIRTELANARQQVRALHVVNDGLREENAQLRERIVKLELGRRSVPPVAGTAS